MKTYIENLSQEEIYIIFRNGDQNERIEFVESSPPSSFKEQALLSVQSLISEMVPQTMDFLALGCIQSGQYKLAEKIAKSSYMLAKERFIKMQGDAMTLRLIAGRSVVNWMTALQKLGLHDKIINLIDEPLEWLKSIGDSDNLHMILLKRVEAELDLEEYDYAEKHLNDIEESSLPVMTQVQYRTIKYRIEQHKGGGTAMPNDIKAPGRKDLLGALEPLLGQTKINENEENDLEYYKTLKDTAGNIINKVFGGASGIDNDLTVRQRIIDASYLFTDSIKGKDPIEINKIIPILIQGRDWMKENNFPDSENYACWVLYLSYNRTNQEENAIEQLNRIRANIEIARSKINNPLERAKLSNQYKYLYACLCTLYYKLGRYKELMEAIEASKSRILADILTQKSGIPSSEREYSKAINHLTSSLKNLNSHYLTTFVDDECIFCLIHTSRGQIQATKVDISRENLNYLGSINNPNLWGKPDKFNPFIKIQKDLPIQLSPLIEFIHPLIKDGEINKYDHLCYSPHDALLSIPFHYIETEGKSLIDIFSLSKIPGAYSLLQILNQNSRQPNQYINIEVPSQQDLVDPLKLNAFKEVGSWLHNNIEKGQSVIHEKASITRLAVINLQEKLLHFATHGQFPIERSNLDPNPFKSSGLLLSANDTLPNLSVMSEGKGEEHLFSPEKIINFNFNFNKSHVTLQACVSGLTKKGFSGDALGLEWALLQNGATSILSTNWNVSAKTTSQFVKIFYENWIKKKTSRSEAWRNAALELKNNINTAAPYHWAAFSLIGDWR